MLLCFFFIFNLLSIAAEAKPYQVLGIGAPCIDFLVNVDNDTLASIGPKGGSIQTDTHFIQNLIGLLQGKDMILSAGGSCSNTIKGLANFGHACGFYGKRGNDEFGKKYIENITELGIVPLISVLEDSSTQICLCLISPDGDRTMRCFPGAAVELTTHEINPDIFEGVMLVHIEGYSLYIKDPDFVETVMRLAKEKGSLVSMDLSSFDLVKIFKTKIHALLSKYVDIVFANEDEIKALTQLEPIEGCKALKEICPIAVVMVGKDGCIVGSGSNIIKCPGCEVKVVDTTGAGDLFISGFLHGILENLSLDMCALYGNMTGAAVVGVYGGEISSSKWDDLKEFRPPCEWGIAKPEIIFTKNQQFPYASAIPKNKFTAEGT